MGRKYVRVNVNYGEQKLKKLLAFIDSGSDVTFISKRVKNKLRIKEKEKEEWYSSAKLKSIISEVAEITIAFENKEITLDVLIDDLPFDYHPNTDEREEVILGLDFLQKAKMNINFDE